MLDDDRHANVGEVLLQRDDVFVEKADAAFTGTARNGALVVGAAVDADALESRGGKTQEPVSVGQDVATAVMKIVFPCRGILYHGNLEGLACGRLGRAHVTASHLVALVFPHTTRELGCHNGVASRIAVIHAERHVAFGDDNESTASGLTGHGRKFRRPDFDRCGFGLAFACVIGARSGDDGHQQQREYEYESVKCFHLAISIDDVLGYKVN